MRLRQMAFASALFATTVLSIASRAQTAATCEPAGGARGEPMFDSGSGVWSFGHSEKGELNSRVAVQTIMLRDTATGRTHGFVLMERGKDHWQGTIQQSQNMSRLSRSGRVMTGTASVMNGGLPVTYALGPDSALVRFMGKTYPLTNGNVLLFDRVDEKDSATVTVGGCFAPTHEQIQNWLSNGPGTLYQMVLRIPAVTAFVGPVTYPLPPP